MRPQWVPQYTSETTHALQPFPSLHNMGPGHSTHTFIPEQTAATYQSTMEWMSSEPNPSQRTVYLNENYVGGFSCAENFLPAGPSLSPQMVVTPLNSKYPNLVAPGNHHRCNQETTHSHEIVFAQMLEIANAVLRIKIPGLVPCIQIASNGSLTVLWNPV